MPDGSVHDHGLALDHARLHTRARLFRRNLDGDSLAQYARLATDGDHLVASRTLHQNITHHAQNPFRGMNDLESKMTATTGQMDTSVLKWISKPNRLRSLQISRESILSTCW